MTFRLILNFFKKTLDKAYLVCYNVKANPKTAGLSNCFMLPAEEELILFI